jgi:hypothetical protein
LNNIIIININKEEIIRHKLSKINSIYWRFLDYDYPIKISKYKHREEIKNVTNIQKIKQHLVEKLGYTTVFFFLTIIFTRYNYKSPYVFMEKGLCILYHLISGNSIRDMNDYMPFTSFYAIYKEFWESNKNDLNRVVTDMLENMFSSTTLRIINAKKKLIQ